MKRRGRQGSGPIALCKPRTELRFYSREKFMKMLSEGAVYHDLIFAFKRFLWSL